MVWWHHWLLEMSFSKLQDMMKVWCNCWGHKSWTWLNDWTAATCVFPGEKHRITHPSPVLFLLASTFLSGFLSDLSFMTWHNVHSYQYDLHGWSSLKLQNVFSLLQVFKPPKNFYYCCNSLVIEILSQDSHVEKTLSNHYSVLGNTPNVDIS